MVDKKHVEYARNLRAQGRTEEQITAALFNSGLADEQVEETIAESLKAASEPAPEVSTEPAAEAAKPKKKWWPFGK